MRVIAKTYPPAVSVSSFLYGLAIVIAPSPDPISILVVIGTSAGFGALFGLGLWRTALASERVEIQLVKTFQVPYASVTDRVLKAGTSLAFRVTRNVPSSSGRGRARMYLESSGGKVTVAMLRSGATRVGIKGSGNPRAFADLIDKVIGFA